MLPTFLIPGAPKAGSSTLYDCFGAHARILMSSAKEPDFFGGRWDEGIAAYEEYFSAYAGETAVGEATVGYLADPRAHERIQRVLPGVKFVIALREPVSRAVSHYWWRVNNGTETRTLDEVLGSDDNYPVQFGLYHSQIRRLLERFELAQMHFVLTDDMADDLAGVLDAAARFLGVEPFPIVAGSSNEASAPRSHAATTALSRASASRLKNVAPRRVRSLASKTVAMLARANTAPFRPPPLRPDQQRLLADAFGSEIDALEPLLGRDLSGWKERA